MFLYKKVEIDKFTKRKPEDSYDNALIISAITEDVADNDSDNVFYFKLNSDVMSRDGSKYTSKNKYMRGVVSESVLEERELYFVSSSIPGFEIFFIDPVLYESISKQDLEPILLDTIDFVRSAEEKEDSEENFDYLFMLEVVEEEDYIDDIDEFSNLFGTDIEIDEDLESLFGDNTSDFENELEKLFSDDSFEEFTPINKEEIKSPLIPSNSVSVPNVNHSHSNELGLFELTGKLREQFGKRFITFDDTLQFSKSIEEFREENDYIYHHEPLLYAINKELLVFANSKDLEDEKFRILVSDENGDLIEVVRYRIVDAMDLMKLMYVSVRDSATMFEIRKKLFELIYYRIE